MKILEYLKLCCLCFVSLCIINLSYAVTSQMTLTEVTFNDLPGWKEDNFENALFAFKQSCHEIMTRHDEDNNASDPLNSRQKWRKVCLHAAKLDNQDNEDAREFFETQFVPYEVLDNGHQEGLFTGYYLPLIHASLKPTKQFRIPIYALPGDWVKVDLGMLRSKLAGMTVVAQVKDNTLYPYPDRATINQDKLDTQARILMWAEDPIDVYFAHVQGSAIVELADGKRLLIGYAGDNGRKYTSIGKLLVTNHELTNQEVSMQSIRAWLSSHPKQIDSLFNQNESFVFFKILSDYHPLGTEKVPLTAERSLAIDNNYIPFGAPLWLTTTIPDNTYHKTNATKNFRHLLIAQDTGGAIKGVIRGDIYWGAGSRAEYIAGYMKNPGRYWLLLPK